MTELDFIGEDPAPGSPAGIRALASIVDVTGDAAHEAAVALRAVGDDLAACSWQGEAADKFDVTFAPIAPDLDLMARSYEKAGKALVDYAIELERLQAAVHQAVNRARLARQREQIAQPQLDAAVARVRDLTRQLDQIAWQQRQKTAELSVASVAAPIAPDAALEVEHELRQLYSNRSTVERALGATRSQQTSFQREVDEARSELRYARSWAEQLRDERRQAERSAATAIRAALEEGLKNKSFFEKARSHVEGTVLHGYRAGEALLHGDVQRALSETASALDDYAVLVRKGLEMISTVLDVLSVALLILAAVALITGVGAPIALALVAAVKTLALVSAVVSIATLATGIWLSVRQRPDFDGERVTTTDVVFDGLGVVTAVAGAHVLGGGGKTIEAVTMSKGVLKFGARGAAEDMVWMGTSKAGRQTYNGLEAQWYEARAGGSSIAVGSCYAK